MKKLLTFLSLSSVSAMAAAHSGHTDAGLLSGLLHPLGGSDHILAMLAVGLWAASLKSKASWLIPAGFVGFMSLGFLLGVNGTRIPLTEQGIAASVLVIGLAAAWAHRIPAAAAASVAAAFALFHGAAHGAEMHGGSAAAFAAGFTASTAALHAAGFLAGRIPGKNVWVNRTAGTLIGAAGLGLLFA